MASNVHARLRVTRSVASLAFPEEFIIGDILRVEVIINVQFMVSPCYEFELAVPFATRLAVVACGQVMQECAAETVMTEMLGFS